MYFKIEKSEDPTQPWYFTIKAANNEVIATSETYHNLQDCKDTIDLIKEEGPMADVKMNNGN